MVEEDKEAGKTTLSARRGTDETSVRTMHADVNAGMIFSNLVAFFIIVTTASTLVLPAATTSQRRRRPRKPCVPLRGGLPSYFLRSA